MVNAFASDFGTLISAVDPTGLLTVQSATLFMTLFLVAASCIVMGAGLPTTATYLVLATMATIALAVLEWSHANSLLHFLLRRSSRHYTAGGTGCVRRRQSLRQI